MRRFLSLLLIAITVFSLCACGETDTSGKTLSFPVSSEPKSLDPQIASDDGARIVAVNCFQGLYRLDENGEPKPDAALSCEVSADGLTYTFTLTRDSRWHLISGLEDMLGENYKTEFDTRVTAHDFVFALKRAVSPETKAQDVFKLFSIKNAARIYDGDLSPEELGVRAADDYTLIIELEQKSNELFAVLASPVAMPCSERFFEATKGHYGLSVSYFLCNGAFYLSKWTQGASLLLRRNPDYLAGSEAAAPVPAAVRLYINSDNASVYEKLAASDYDAAFAPLPADASALSECTVTEYANIVSGLLLNPSNSFLSDPDIRLALIKSLERESILDAAGSLTHTRGFIPEVCSIDGLNYRETAGALEYGLYDEQDARLLWQSGLERLGTQTVTLAVSCSEANKTALGKVMQNWQRVLGLTLSITLNVLTDDKLNSAVSSGSYDIAFTDRECTDFSAYEFLSGVSFASLLPDSYFNELDAVASAQSTQEAVRHCIEAEKILLEAGVFYPVCTQKSGFILANGSSGIYLASACDKIYFHNGRRTD
ncbi:MAG: peptide ABC transporter substrate-binding protein [Clostridiales bacterium]|nr:peptide ABC transporter substrate-binding protein [Clostridiales bacterium]